MALEPAGISLVAENFNKYIKQLGRVDKAQQEIFNVDDKELASALENATKALRAYEKALRNAGKKTSTFSKNLSLAATGGIGLATIAVSGLTSAFTSLASSATSAFVEITKGGVALNQQFELSEKVFSNVFGDPNLGEATVDFLNETSDRLRIARKDALGFAQVILPKTGGLDEFTELLRLTDIQVDSTGKSFDDLRFSIQNALAGQFESLKDLFDLDPTQITRIQELTPSLGVAAAVAKVLGEEFARLGKTDISGTLETNIKDLNTRFSNLQATLGKPTFEQLRVQSDNLLQSLDRNQEGLERTAIALGEVTANVVELVGTEIVEFIDSLDFKAIETGIDNVNKFVETLRVLSKTIKVAFETGVIQTAFGLLTGNVDQLLTGIGKVRQADFGQAFRDISQAVDTASERQTDYKNRVDEAANAQSSFTSESEMAINAFLAQGAAQDQLTKSVKGFSNALKQAENLQRSFGRAAEDTAIRRARAAEDVARSQQKAVSDLESRQAKDRDKLLGDQIKQLEKFDADRQKQIKQAEADVAKERKKARDQRRRDEKKLFQDQRRRDEKKLFQDLERERERFNLSQLQSERRFSLSERRLRAEGDILALQQLREDRELERQEEKENFDLGQKDQKQSGLEQIREQEKVSNERINELKASLEDQRAELLKSFDEQVEAQRQAQLEAQELQRQRFAEDAVNRQIALQREEEDRQLSQQRQLEDLGRSFAEQEGVTVEGTTAIANQLEKVFGIDGTADSIISGFTAKTENEFTDLFNNLEKTIVDSDIADKAFAKVKEIEETAIQLGPISAGGFGGRIGGIPEFQEGGIVPGPVGAPVPAIVHAGETILPTHQSSFTMTAPVIPSQTLMVQGGINVQGSGFGQANDQIVREAMIEVTESFNIAIERLARRN
jgi:hypothetical protein